MPLICYIFWKKHKRSFSKEHKGRVNESMNEGNLAGIFFATFNTSIWEKIWVANHGFDLYIMKLPRRFFKSVVNSLVSRVVLRPKAFCWRTSDTYSPASAQGNAKLSPRIGVWSAPLFLTNHAQKTLSKGTETTCSITKPRTMKCKVSSPSLGRRILRHP